MVSLHPKSRTVGAATACEFREAQADKRVKVSIVATEMEHWNDFNWIECQSALENQSRKKRWYSGPAVAGPYSQALITTQTIQKEFLLELWLNESSIEMSSNLPPNEETANKESTSRSSPTASASTNTISQPQEVTIPDLLIQQSSLESEAAEVLPFDCTRCTRSLGPLRQSIYSCLTCNPPQETQDSKTNSQAGICASCSHTRQRDKLN
ncbi:uncharacterized protein MELLADRAFT_92541 [Melampsora larici-populina 98AG31]|uniref:Uncharacterized protein n=1 Tax=Melampsora larici-populina (strain 98AG31 / pathotype 3-4-7) TaxID=747676 RepID=F4S1X3_MELLP|nr:uncharacterized protein MELLADRAFT_92541 [Melampsora larici-populina 98AG31]EGG01366.1 hypothetical protein MELLADRAFT_92541 [Melampsora larici-populina 98AG31]